MSFLSGESYSTPTGEGIYEPTIDYVNDILEESKRLYESNIGREYFPGSTVVPFAPQTQAALDLSQGLGYAQTGGSGMYDMSRDILGGFAAGAMPNAYSQLTPQGDYLSDLRSGILSDVMGNISSQFGGMGRTGTSPAAQQAAARGFTSEYAPIAAKQASLERGRELGSIESGIGRQYTAAQALPELQNMIDRRQAAGIERISDVGSAYEDLAARQLQDQIDRYQFSQTSPYARFSQFYSPIFTAAGLANPGLQYNKSPNPLTSAFGLAQAGYGLGQPFGYGGIGAILGGLGGLLG
jgi:hypothetical protein